MSHRQLILNLPKSLASEIKYLMKQLSDKNKKILPPPLAKQDFRSRVEGMKTRSKTRAANEKISRNILSNYWSRKRREASQIEIPEYDIGDENADSQINGYDDSRVTQTKMLVRKNSQDTIESENMRQDGALTRMTNTSQTVNNENYSPDKGNELQKDIQSNKTSCKIH